jgi:RepB DNA-primase from phage plasmid
MAKKETGPGERADFQGESMQRGSALPFSGNGVESVKVGVVGPDGTERRGRFFAQVFGSSQGYLCLAKKKPDGSGWRERSFRYPEDLDEALFWIDEALPTHNLYFCAQLLSKPKRIKENVPEVALLWADLDPCPPSKLRVYPTFVLETSPYRYQAIWRLEEAIDGELAERLSHAIAREHEKDGVDQSGWDRTQLLRIPFTWNFKYGETEHPTVKILDARVGHYRVDDFKVYPPVTEPTGATDAPVPNLDGPPTVEELLERLEEPERARKLYAERGNDHKERRSGALWELEGLCRESGLSPTDTLKVVSASAPNKYRDDGRTIDELWREIQKNYAQHRAAQEGFWTSRPELAHVRQFARARRANPMATLGVVLARVIGATHPRLVLPPLVGGDASLNFFVGLVGNPGSGKDAAIRAGKDAVNVGELPQINLGSGEGIAHQYVTTVPEEDDAGNPIRGKSKMVQYRASVLFVSPEIETLKAVASRQASTLMSVLRDTYMGSALGFAYVDKDKRITLDEQSYRLCLITGIQPKKSDILLSESDVGTPQRFVWMPTCDREMPQDKPPEPQPWSWSPPPALRPSLIPPKRIEVKVCPTAADAIDQAALDRARGKVDALDGHALLAREKVAAALALFAGRADIDESDWQLAGYIHG